MAKIKNRARLRRRMLALAPSIKAEIRPAMADGADEITSMQKSLVHVKSGATEDSIGWVWGAVNHGNRGNNTLQQFNDLLLSIFAANNHAFYGRFEEFGTVKMRPRPFFFGPYRALRKRVVSRMARATNKALKKAGEIA